MKKLNYKSIIKATLKNGGSTTPLTNNVESGRYAVAISNFEMIVTKDLFSYQLVEAYHDLLPKSANGNLGTWINPENDKVYLDFSLTYNDLENAVRVAYNNEQLAIYDTELDKTISIEINELD